MMMSFATIAHAQDEVSKQVWLDYNPAHSWASGLKLYGDFGTRTQAFDQGWFRIIARPSVRGPWGSFHWAAGVGGFYTFNELFADRFEIRPFQGISAVWPRAPVRIDHYARLEQRFEFRTTDWDLTPSLRFRYRTQIQLHWSGVSRGAHWRVLAHLEGFLTLSGETGQFDEKVRIGVGVERGFGKTFRVRIDVTWQQTGALITGSSTDDVYLRVRLFHD